MHRNFLAIPLAIAATYFLGGLLLFFFQRNLIYFPTSKIDHDFNELILENDEQKIRVISLNEGNESAILYFGGNAESMAFTAMEFHARLPSFSIYLMNYRGYGGSSGYPEEDGLYADALQLYDSLRSMYNDVFVVGRSLGSGVATYVASQRPVSRLVLVTPFDSVENVAQEQFPFYPIWILLKDKFDSASRAKAIDSKVLILSADGDRVISKKRTDNLAASLSRVQLTQVVINNSGHNSLSENNKFYNAIHQFLQ